jgi:hypothetical protein
VKQPDLMALFGRRVTITNPNNSASWTGTLIAATDGPSVIIDQDTGPRMTLPQRFTITPADEPQPEPSPASGYLVGARVHGQPDLVAKLDGMLANLQQHIDQRAADLAAPHIAEIGLAAGKEVADAQAGQRRAEDLVAELRRHISALERRRDEQRQRAERAEAAVERMRTLIDSYPPGSDFVQCGAAQLFRDHLDGTKGQQESNRG